MSLHSLHRRFKLLDFLISREKTLHFANQHVHLLKSGAVGKSGVNLKHHLIVAVPIISVHNFFGKKAESSTKNNISIWANIFIVNFRAKHIVVNL